MTLKIFKYITGFFLVAFFALFGIIQTGCGVYRFKDVSIPDSIKTVKVNFIQNTASYVNPQLAPKLTDKLRQKIVSQTKLGQTNGDNADWEVNCKITQYGFSTAGISQQRVNQNRLNVGVHIELDDKRAHKISKYDVTRSFDYAGTLSLQQAEQDLGDEMVRSLSDDIFNRIFSNW